VWQVQVVHVPDEILFSCSTADTRVVKPLLSDGARHATVVVVSRIPIANGAPIRLRVERQLGYKMAKYVMRIELVDSFAKIGEGKGGYWEDQGYQWYAGI